MFAFIMGIISAIIEDMDAPGAINDSAIRPITGIKATATGIIAISMIMPDSIMKLS